MLRLESSCPNSLLRAGMCRLDECSTSCHRLGDVAWRAAAKSQDETLARLFQITAGKRPKPKVFARGLPGYRPVTPPPWKCHDQMHTRFCSQDFNARPELLPDGVNQYVPAFAVEHTRFPDVTHKM